MTASNDRTIPATPRRREAARREGLMPNAAPLSWAAAALVTMLLVPTWARATVPAAAACLRECIAAAAVVGPTAPELRLAMVSAPAVWAPTVGLVLAAAAAGLAVRLVLDGFSWQPARAAIDLARLDPWAGLVRIVSPRTLAVSCGNAVALVALGCATLAAAGPLAAASASPDTLLDPVRGFRAAWPPLVAGAAMATVVAAVQYAVARLRFEQRIRMTPQEFADEAKSLQADPKIRLLFRERARRPAAFPSRV